MVKLKKVANLEGHEHPIYALCISQKEHILFSAGGEGAVVEWSLKKMAPIKVMFKTRATIYSLHCPKSLPLLISGDRNGQISIFDFIQQKIVFQKQLTEKPIFGMLSVGNLLYFISEDGTLRTFDLVQFKIIEENLIANESLRSIAFNEHDQLIYIGAKDNRIYSYSIIEKRVIRSDEEHTLPVFSLAYDEQAQVLYSGSRDAQIKIWNDNKTENIAAHLYAVNDLLLIPETNFLLSASMDKSIKVWDKDTQQLLAIGDAQRNDGHQKSVNVLAYTVFENYVISAGDDRMIFVWTLDAGQ
jgi:WD40 repeat protein